MNQHVEVPLLAPEPPSLAESLTNLLADVEAGVFDDLSPETAASCIAAREALAAHVVAKLETRVAFADALKLARGEIDGAQSDISVALREAYAMGMVASALALRVFDRVEGMDYEASIQKWANARRAVLRGMRLGLGRVA